MPRSANAKKTAKKPSKLAWSVVHVLPAAVHAAVARQGAALVVAARAAATLAVQVAIVAKAGEAADKSHARCTKNACPFKGNPLKRLK